MWEVMNARKKIQAEWEAAPELKEMVNGWGGRKTEEITPAGLESTTVHFEKMKEMAQKPARELRKDGDPETAFKNAAQIIERTYYAPFLPHNCMEPMNFFADVKDGKAVMAGPSQGVGMAAGPQSIGSGSGARGPLGQTSPTKSYPPTTFAVGKSPSVVVLRESAVLVP